MAKSLPNFCLPNVTALLQPLGQGMLKSIKRVLKDLVSQSTFTIHDFLKRIDIINVVNTVASAWDMVTPTAIRSSWKKLIPMQNSDMLEETTNSEFIQCFLRIYITFTDDDIQNWMSCDGPGTSKELLH